jgi:hypothetical protein
MSAPFRIAAALGATFALAGVFLAQEPPQTGIANPGLPLVPPQDVVWVCPMDPDVRSHNPGTCPRCGMKLANGIPEPREYHLELAVNPRPPKPGVPADLVFRIHDPWKQNPVKNFQVIHEKLFHMFVVSEDLQFFLHDHPTLREDGSFLYRLAFPKPGMFRVLGDFYPDGATPQLIPKTVMVPGKAPAAVALTRDYSPKTTENLEIELTTDPQQPIAGLKTQLHFKLKPAEGIEKLLGAWGHMLVASDDLIDMIHEHPFIADGGPQIQFNATFPRPIPYRVWVQFQRNGVVNTAHFDIKAEELR